MKDLATFWQETGLNYDPDEWEKFLRPHTQEFDVTPESFSPDLVETIENVNRPVTVYSMADLQGLPGLESGCYEMQFESHLHPSEEPQTKTYFVGVKADEGLQTAMTLPESSTFSEHLQDLKETPDGIQGAPSDLVRRIRGFDKSRQEHGPKADQPQVWFDPDEFDYVKDMANRLGQIVNDSYVAQRYFHHMASLETTGRFADNNHMRLMSGLHGLRNNGEHSPIHAFVLSGRDYDAENIPGMDATDNLKDVLSKAWYKSDDLNRDLNWGSLVIEMDKLGRMWRHGQEVGGYATGKGTMATASIMSEIYSALTGEEDLDDHVGFADKIDRIGQITGNKHITDEFVDTYLGDDGAIGVRDIRGTAVHHGSMNFGEESADLDEWASVYMNSLAKTMLSCLKDQPEPDFSYDFHARRKQMHGGKNQVTVVPAKIAQHFDRNYVPSSHDGRLLEDDTNQRSELTESKPEYKQGELFKQ